ncbi:MAG TPA: endonuclease/exonuclease/phosphatase family protein [Anaerohalosphaeraceae bacterium]|nr:endonuclease/exonuclease/phosphatase family protein [Anaerohalosphaeraceae bacterium]
MNQNDIRRLSLAGLAVLSFFIPTMPARTPSEQVPLPKIEPGVVKVMTFNIRNDTIVDGPNRWSRRKNIVFNMLRDHNADVIGLQEAEDEQVCDIQMALPCYSRYAVGRNDGRRQGETCAIFYRTDRFRLLDSGTFWFSDTPSVPGTKDWGNLWPRICSWVRLAERQSGQAFYVYNVHLDNLSQHSRQKSVELLARQVASRKSRDPFIVMGDFNMELDNPAMRYLQKQGIQTPYPRMVDAWSSVHSGKPSLGTRHSFRGSISGPAIDHIPICETLQALDVSIDRRAGENGRYPSDHFPVIARILLKPSTLPEYAALSSSAASSLDRIP